MTVLVSGHPLPVELVRAPRRRAVRAGLALAAVGIALFIAALFAGGERALWPLVVPGAAANDPVGWLILTEIRLPRALLAVLVGATLGLSGAAMQGLLRNPLADPGLIGVSSMAALGAVLVLYFGLAGVAIWLLPLGGLGGALVAILILYALAGRDASVLTLILAGLALGTLASALTSLALNFAPSPYAALEIVFWILGSLADRSFMHVWLALPFMAAGATLLMGSRKGLDALTLGEDAAHSLGVNLNRTRLLVILGTALSVGAAVSVTGVIGFVGLMVPHLLRPWASFRPSALLPLSALGGAVLMLGADLAVRTLSGGQELKLGVVTALIGGPFFVLLLLKTRRAMR
ncbi:MAG: iron ABC transporter permease [Alphaproteobacteria bacterium]|nr:MAG: iron ABC transporter permease [Alphaproteobacteria bacterium]